MDTSYLLGKLGEETAARFLQQAGYQIIARNFRYAKAEIDLIARKGDILAVVEVKTRTGPSLERIPEAVNRRKRDRLIQAADHFITSKGLEVDARFDIIWVTSEGGSLKLELIENAFYYF